MPFDDDDDDIPPTKSKVGIKLNNSQSIVSKNKKPSTEEFHKKAQEANKKTLAYTDRAKDLSVKFIKLLEDKTLLENKNTVLLDLEKEIISDLVGLGIDINSDENELDGMGSIGLTSLIFKCLMRQRDRINNLEYNLYLLDKRVKKIELSSIDIKKHDE